MSSAGVSGERVCVCVQEVSQELLLLLPTQQVTDPPDLLRSHDLKMPPEERLFPVQRWS